MNRRDFLKKCAAVGAGGFVLSDRALEVYAGTRRPNIVLILADDLGYSDLGCYGGEIQTPNLDRLAAEGLRFSQFYNTAKCAPTRTSLLSGLFWQDAGQGIQRGITMAQALQAAGYATLAVGKWHLKGNPVQRGFDRYFGHLSGATDYFKGNNTWRLDEEPFTDFKEDFYSTDAKTNYAIRFVEQAHQQAPNKPFFLYLAYNAPHYPLQAWPQDIAKYRGKFLKGWDQLRQERYDRLVAMGLIKKQWSLSPRPEYIPAWESLNDQEREFEDKRMSAYAAMVDRMDQNIGRLMAKLKELRADQNTLVMFLSDNGGCPFDRRRNYQVEPGTRESKWEYGVAWANVSNTPFRLYKRNQHEGGIATPFIAWWPAVVRKVGAITDQCAHLIDVMPTVLELAGWSWPRRFEGQSLQALPGKSLLPIFEDKERRPHSALFFQFINHRAVIEADWKLVSAFAGPWELYRLGTDRTELHNLAAKYPEKAKQLEQLWLQWWGDRGGSYKKGGTKPSKYYRFGE
jgi:arylsulfatase